MRLSACFYSQDLYLASQNRTKIYQKCIRPRVRAVLTKQIFSIPKAFPAGHMGNMSKGKDKGIGKICSSKPTWFDSRTAKAYDQRSSVFEHRELFTKNRHRLLGGGGIYGFVYFLFLLTQMTIPVISVPKGRMTMPSAAMPSMSAMGISKEPPRSTAWILPNKGELYCCVLPA